MERDGFTLLSGELAVLNAAAAIPDDIADACSKVFFGQAGNVISQETGELVELYSTVGTVPMHRDNYFESEEDNFACLGFVLVNECDACITDGTAILPIPAGSVFRHNPSRLHGTCRPDGSHTTEGNFVFLTWDFDTEVDLEDHPRDFAAWALDQAREKLTELGLIEDNQLAAAR